jgi:hypothetical protein
MRQNTGFRMYSGERNDLKDGSCCAVAASATTATTNATTTTTTFY